MTPRQSWLFSFYVVINKNNKKDKMKLENITIIFYSVMYYCPFFHYTTLGGFGGLGEFGGFCGFGRSFGFG